MYMTQFNFAIEHTLANDPTNFEGLAQADGSPSDSCGAVGPSHYVQTVNDRIAVFDKSTGQMLDGYPKPGYDLYSQFPGTSEAAEACRTATWGDNTVQWDRNAERWVFSEFAWIDDYGPYYQVY